MVPTVDDLPQPTVALVHQKMRPYLTKALEEGRYKLMAILAEAAGALASEAGFAPALALCKLPYRYGGADPRKDSLGGWDPGGGDAVQGTGGVHWFENLNTPEEFAEAERREDEPDTF